MRTFILKTLACLLSFNLLLTPGLVGLAFAQEPVPASDKDLRAVQQLARAGYLGGKKDLYLSAKKLTQDDITDALLKMNDLIMKTELKAFEAEDSPYRLEDLQTLLKLAQDHAADIRARKVSAWKLENRLQKVIAVLSPDEDEPATTTQAPAATPTVPAPTPTATAIPGPSREEWNELRQSFKELSKKTLEMQDAYDLKLDSIKKGNEDIKFTNSDNQEQLKLVKKLLDRVQDDLKKCEARMDAVDQKVQQKLTADTEMQQELSVMHKDLRDNTEDITVLRQQLAKIDKSDSLQNQNAVDDFLGSKWLAGGALVIGLTALTISLTR